MPDHKLPALPEPFYGRRAVFTTDQLRAYGQSCYEAGRLAALDNPSPAMYDAMRIGSRKDCPSAELCRVRLAALAAVLKAKP